MLCAGTLPSTFSGAFLVMHIAYPIDPIIITSDTQEFNGEMVFTSESYYHDWAVGTNWHVTVDTTPFFTMGQYKGEIVRVTEVNGHRRRVSTHYSHNSTIACTMLGQTIAPNAPIQSELNQTYPVDVLLQAPHALGALVGSTLYTLCPLTHNAPTGLLVYGGAFNVTVKTDTLSGVPIARLSYVTIETTLSFSQDMRPVITSLPRPTSNKLRFRANDTRVMETYTANHTVEMGAWYFNSTLSLFPFHAGPNMYGLLDSPICPPPVFVGRDHDGNLTHECDEALIDPSSHDVWCVSNDTLYYDTSVIQRCGHSHLVMVDTCSIGWICIEPYFVRVYSLFGDDTPSIVTSWTYTGTYRDTWWIFVNGGDCETTWFIFGVLDDVLVLYKNGVAATYISSVEAIDMSQRSSAFDLVTGACDATCTITVSTVETLTNSFDDFTTVYDSYAVPIYSFDNTRIIYRGYPSVFDWNPSISLGHTEGGVVFLIRNNRVYRGYLDDIINEWNPPYTAVVESIRVYGQYIALSGNGTTRIHDAGSIVLSNTNTTPLCYGGTRTISKTSVYEIGGSSVYAKQYTSDQTTLLVGLSLNQSTNKVVMLWKNGLYYGGIVYCDATNASTVTRLHIPYMNDWCVAEDEYINPYVPSTELASCASTETSECVDIDVPNTDNQASWNAQFCEDYYQWDTHRVCNVSYHVLSEDKPIAVVMMYLHARRFVYIGCGDLSQNTYTHTPLDTTPHIAFIGNIRTPVQPKEAMSYVMTTPPTVAITNCSMYQYQATPPTATTNRVCHIVTQCLSTEHISAPATTTTDNQCRPKVYTCIEGKYLNLSANEDGASSDQCLDCPEGTTTYNTACLNGSCPNYHTSTACTSEPFTCDSNQYLTSTSPKQCLNCTSCASTLVECTPSTDRICTLVSPSVNTCPAQTYRVAGVDAYGECLPCHVCRLVQSECTPTTDRECESLSREKYYMETSLYCLLAHAAWVVYARWYAQ